MEKSYPATAIKRISENTLVYEDENGEEQDVCLIKCRDNWYENYSGKDSLIDILFQKRKNCKNVGDRFWGYCEAYFIFYSDIKIKFQFEFEHKESTDAYENFGYIKEQLKNAGWITFDIG